MRILIVEPGPQFSVQDVADGWAVGLQKTGQQVGSFNLGPCLHMFTGAWYHNPTIDAYLNPYSFDQAMALAGDHLLAHVTKTEPDVVVIVYGRFVQLPYVDLIRRQGIKVVYLFTESPYEDEKQITHAQFVDLCVVNDPTNLDRFPNGYYQPHSYDPEIHYPRETVREWDFSFVGTGFDSRVEFFEQVEWGDLDVRFAGNWPTVTDNSPIRDYIGTDPEECIDNPRAADLYRASGLSANLYRKEADAPELVAGWAMGPREVELAACGTFFLRESRPEGDELFPFLPTFTGPGEFTDLLHFYAARPEACRTAGTQALSAIADRTFEHAAGRLVSKLDNLGVT